MAKVLTQATREALRAYVDRYGLLTAAANLGVAAHTLEHARDGRNLRRGTVIQITHGLAMDHGAASASAATSGEAAR